VAADSKAIVTIGACHSTFSAAGRAVLKSDLKMEMDVFVPGTPTKTSMPFPAAPA